MYNDRSNKTVKIPLADIPRKIMIILAAYKEITLNYFKDFAQDEIKDYETLGSSTVNEIFPCYRMDEDEDANFE